MLVFLEEQQQYVNSELESFEAEVYGTCNSSINSDKAKVLIKNKRNQGKSSDAEHTLFVELSSKWNCILKFLPFVSFLLL